LTGLSANPRISENGTEFCTARYLRRMVTTKLLTVRGSNNVLTLIVYPLLGASSISSTLHVLPLRISADAGHRRSNNQAEPIAIVQGETHSPLGRGRLNTIVLFYRALPAHAHLGLDALNVTFLNFIVPIRIDKRTDVE